jgi:hypothetical protein
MAFVQSTALDAAAGVTPPECPFAFAIAAASG